MLRTEDGRPELFGGGVEGDAVEGGVERTGGRSGGGG